MEGIDQQGVWCGTRSKVEALLESLGEDHLVPPPLGHRRV